RQETLMQFVKRIRFGKARQDASPEPLLLPTSTRTVRAQAVDDVLSRLPAEGQALHVLLTDRRMDLTTLLVAMIDRIATIERMTVPTLSFSSANRAALLALLDAGKVTTLDLLACSFFRNCNKTLWSEARTALHRRGQRIAAARTHAKV